MKTTLVVKRINKTKPLVEQKLEECARFSLEDVIRIEAPKPKSFTIYSINNIIYSYDDTDYYDYMVEFC
jgi:hypothetical protein